MKAAIIIARILSTVFRPVYYPLLGIFILFTISYFSMLPWMTKLYVMMLVGIFTLLLPYTAIYIYRRLVGLRRHELRHRENRFVPYLIFLLSYLFCLHLLRQLHFPHLVTGIILVSLLVQVVCFLVNLRWKISTHSAGSGAIIGALVAYSILFRFDPVWWLCLAILVSGLVMSSRMLLRQHTLGQVLCGTLMGIICGYIGIIV